MRPLVAAPSTAEDWATRYYHADGLGSIRRLTDEAGTITDGYTYSAFGELLAHTGTDPQPYAFTGEPLDSSSGWQYHRARWMDPRVGRFIGLDTLAGNDESPASLHKYLYVSANPLNLVDPTGHVGEGGLAGSLATLGGYVTLAALRAPQISAVLLAVAQTLAPNELGVLPGQMGIWQMRGAAASAGPVVVEELSNIRRVWLSLGNRATGPLGIAFEKWIARFLRVGTRTQVAVREGFELGIGPGSGSRAGAAILDYVDDVANVVYEVKASFRAVKYNQALQAAHYSAQSGKKLVYVFLKKPTAEQLMQLSEWLGEGAKAAEKTLETGYSSVF
jgi:RHS repeat-associated protein